MKRKIKAAGKNREKKNLKNNLVKEIQTPNKGKISVVLIHMNFKMKRPQGW